MLSCLCIPTASIKFLEARKILRGSAWLGMPSHAKSYEPLPCSLGQSMYLSHLTLNEFRNYKHLELSLGQGLFLFYGENAQGKTNLLEAVAMLATGSSFHATSDREVVDWYAPDHIARILGNVKRREDDVQLEMVIFDPTPLKLEDQPPRTIELPANTPRKRV